MNNEISLKEINIINKVLKECEILEDILNNKLLKKFAEIHNITPKNSILNLKQELVASSALFYKKKKYSLYILNKEKKAVSEYDIKGISIKRSNYPPFTKETIEMLLDLIMKEEIFNLGKINEFIEVRTKMAEILCKEHSKEIAGAVSFNKELENYKQIPSQVLAMTLWNNWEYDYFRSGSKGYLFRIKGVDQNKAPDRVLKKLDLFTMKNKSIVIPFEEEKLPDYYILDLDAQMNFVIKNRIDEIMEVFKQQSFELDDSLFDLFE